MAARDALGIDFGTANSYYCKCPGDQLSPSGVNFRAGMDGLATAILYRKGDAPLVGHVAIEEYGDAGQEERTVYTLRTQFKPDIVTGAEAQRSARDFLAAVLEEAKSRKLDIDPTRREVIIGVPSAAGTDFRNVLSKIAGDAGYGQVRMVDEPKGALLYHFFHKDIPATDAQKGLLVIDFGAGTCNFAFMCRGSVRHSWGDMELGGRLFDDLFFQWFLEENACAFDTMKSEGREFFVLWKECREKKESFSQKMTRDRKQKLAFVIDHGRWKIADATWDEFIRRAQSYRPSPTFMQCLANIGGSPGKFGVADVRIDLLGCFRDRLMQGLRDKRIDKSDVRFVILAGGSSQWPFVADIVREELHIEDSRVMRSDRPYATISEGLAILPALQRTLGEKQKKLRSDHPTFMREKLVPLLERYGEQAAEQVANVVVRELFDGQVKPILLRFRENGGAIASLEQNILSVASASEPRTKALVENEVAVLTKGLPEKTNELVSNWLKEYGIATPEIDPTGSTNIETVRTPAPCSLDVYNGAANQMAVIPGAIAAVAAASICGGGGLALIMAGPIGWLIGLAIGAVTVYLAIRLGAVAAKARAKKWPIPSRVVRMLHITPWGPLGDRNINKARENFKAECLAKIKGEVQKKVCGPFEKRVGSQIQSEIDALSEISQIAPQ